MIQSTKISSRHQTAVPSVVRKALNIGPGDRMYWHITYRSSRSQPLIVAGTKPKQLAKTSRGLGKHLWDTIDIGSYLNNLRKEWNKRI